jgi:hypothetical protein
MKKMLFALSFMLLAFCSCKQYKILAVQDFKKDANGKLQAIGSPHLLPDTVTIFHAYVWIKGNKIYPY